WVVGYDGARFVVKRRPSVRKDFLGLRQGEDLFFRTPGGSSTGVWLLRPKSYLPALYWIPFTPEFQSPTFQVVGFADLDGDKRTDVVWRGPSHDVYWWQGGQGPPVDPLFFHGIYSFTSKASAASAMVRLGDFDGDNRVDILWRSDTEQTVTIEHLIRQTNGLMASHSAEVFAMGNYQGWDVQAVADFNRDGRA